MAYYHLIILQNGNLTRNENHRAVAPVIATLLLVAISVVGGTIIFVFSQGFFQQTQISGTPTIELIKILGYDARDIAYLEAHDGQPMVVQSSDPNNPGKNVGERIIVYIKNDSVHKVLFSEISLGGKVYSYHTVENIEGFVAGSGGNYGILDSSTTMKPSPSGIEEAGEIAGIIIELDDHFPIGRDVQFKLVTANGAVFVGTVIMGQNIG